VSRQAPWWPPTSCLDVTLLTLATCGQSGQRSGEHCVTSSLSATRPQIEGLTAQAALPARVVAQRAQEVDTPEIRPVDLTEVVLRVHRLPQQEAGQTLLTRGADDQVRIRLALGVQVLGDVLLGQRVRYLLQGGPGRGPLAQEIADRVGDLLPPAVADGDIDLDPSVTRVPSPPAAWVEATA